MYVVEQSPLTSGSARARSSFLTPPRRSELSRHQLGSRFRLHELGFELLAEWVALLLAVVNPRFLVLPSDHFCAVNRTKVGSTFEYYLPFRRMDELGVYTYNCLYALLQTHGMEGLLMITTRKVRKRSMWLVGIGLVAGVAAASPVWADPMSFSLAGVNDPNLTASVLFSYLPATGTVDIGITNTSTLAAGPDPRLTSFAFNAPSGVTGISTFSSPSGWSSTLTSNSINTPGQFGFFDIAALTGPNFNGGSPNAGIPPSSTFNFQFVLTGAGLLGLTESSFLSVPSFDAAGNPDEAEQYFIGRFQRTGLNGEGSDVAIPTGSPNVVPPTGPPTGPGTSLASPLGVRVGGAWSVEANEAPRDREVIPTG